MPGGVHEKVRKNMKIVIEKLGDNLAVSFTGKGKKFDRLMLLTVATVETLVDSLVPGLSDAQLQEAAGAFANDMKAAITARYKMNASDRKEEFTGREAAFLSKLFGL